MAVAGGWFESVAEAQRRAKKRLPTSVYGALIAGGQAGHTMQDNLRAFDEVEFLPYTADLPRERALGTTVMGQQISLPVLISPTGVQAVHPEGEVAVARAAAAAGTAMGLSSFASRSVEDVCAVHDQVLFQVYWCGDKDDMLHRVERARNAGAKGLIVTLDWTFSNGRDWGSPTIPEKMDLKTMLAFAPEGLRRPRWLLDFIRGGGVPELTAPNMAKPGGAAPTFFEAYYEWMSTPLPTWADVAWLRAQWDGPFMVKGIMRADQARAAVDAGATAVSVSNHGGNNLDSTPSPLRALPSIAAAVSDQIEIVLDSGVRRGGDVVKALALGARAVMIGRAYLWGLAANGQAGVQNVLDLLRGGIDSALLGLGRESVHDLRPSDVLLPPGFTREPTA